MYKILAQSTKSRKVDTIKSILRKIQNLLKLKPLLRFQPNSKTELARPGMVSIKHGKILHGCDSARPIGHGPIVHENNQAPYRFDTARFSTGSIVHESVMQKRLGTGSIVHKSFMQKRFGTGSIVHETVIQERFSDGSIVHESVLQKRFGTGSIVLFYIILYLFFYILYFFIFTGAQL